MKKFIFVAIAMLVSVVIAGAQTTKVSEKSTVLQTIVVPDGTPIHSGVTRTGNPKYWVTLTFNGESKDVTVSESLAKKYQSGAAKIEIVKRKDNSTGRITYSARTLGGRQSKKSVDINLSQVIFN